MRYQQPYGAVAEAPYQNGNPAIGLKGSIPPAEAIEHHQRELVHLIQHSGQVPSAGDLQQVRKAIQAMIDASILAIGSPPDLSGFLTVAQARARLLFFPDVTNSPYHFGVVTPGTGQVRVPAGVAFMHRGVFPITTVQVDIATSPSKTYHLRWSASTGNFTLKDLSDGGYNPGALADDNVAFDSTYDDMLVAKVVTNGSNVPTITNLLNRNRLSLYTTVPVNTGTGNSFSGNWSTAAYNWARTPQSYLNSFISRGVYEQFTDPLMDLDTQAFITAATRYAISGTYVLDFVESGFTLGVSARA